MPTYRKPGVYLEESPLTGSSDIGIANATTVFGGAAIQGPTVTPARIDAWNDYATIFGGFQNPVNDLGEQYFSYLPYAVYSYFQNGGRSAYVMRAVNAQDGSAAAYTLTNVSDAFTVSASSVGEWGNDLSVKVVSQSAAPTFVFSLLILRNGIEVERFTNLSPDGEVEGTKRVDVAVNDEVYGSRLVTVSDINTAIDPPSGENDLIGGSDGAEPSNADVTSATVNAAAEVDGPVLVNSVPFEKADGTLVIPTVPSPTAEAFADRGDVFVINDSVAPRGDNITSADYATNTLETSLLTSANQNSSYCASYSPWIVVPDPAVPGGTRTIPPGGSVAGVYARTDATEGVFRAPAGVLASVNAVGVDAKFSDLTLGSLNSTNHINVIRPVAGAGIAIMGARTRKKYGYDRYVSARRTLIYIKESLKSSTQFAVFENNNQRLWTRLRSTADRILRPVWSSGGLRGSSASEAYYVICDDSINTPAVISSGEVRMEIGVSLTAPAEFIVIRLSQYEGGGSEVTIS